MGRPVETRPRGSYGLAPPGASPHSGSPRPTGAPGSRRLSLMDANRESPQHPHEVAHLNRECQRKTGALTLRISTLRIRRLYSAVNTRRCGFATTCTSSPVMGTSTLASMGLSSLALYTNYLGTDCLIHLGTEGTALEAVQEVHHALCAGHTEVIDGDVSQYFDASRTQT